MSVWLHVLILSTFWLFNWRIALCRTSLLKHLATAEVSFLVIASMLHNSVLPWDAILSICYTKRSHLVYEFTLMLNRWSGVLKFWEVHISWLDWCLSRKWAKHSYTYELPLSCMLKSAQTFIVSALFEHFRLTDGDTHCYHPLQSLIPPQNLFVICVGAMCKLCIRHTSQWEC